MAKQKSVDLPCVDYHRFNGATCTKCGRIQARTIKTMPHKEDEPVIRYHWCQNCSQRLKSVEKPMAA